VRGTHEVGAFLAVRLTPCDYAALTALIWEHVNPYGRFDLDMNARLALL
jgi:hypothetical protein